MHIHELKRGIKYRISKAEAFLHKLTLTRLSLLRNKGKSNRKLEIGPSFERIEGFETLNIFGGRNTDYVWDAIKRLPFKDSTFDLIYASHILEHVPWFMLSQVLREWFRILKPGGAIEIWVPDGLKICKAFVDAEINNDNYIENDGWYRLNPDRDPCVWASGRIFTYGDESFNTDHPNWHHAIFSSRYLKKLLEEVGFTKVEKLNNADVRGYNHRWINLGIRGEKSAELS